jgi:hypothetical protein
VGVQSFVKRHQHGGLVSGEGTFPHIQREYTLLSLRCRLAAHDSQTFGKTRRPPPSSEAREAVWSAVGGQLLIAPSSDPALIDMSTLIGATVSARGHALSSAVCEAGSRESPSPALRRGFRDRYTGTREPVLAYTPDRAALARSFEGVRLTVSKQSRRS